MTCQNDTPGNGIELCNGLDDNCDGNTDEAFPTLGQACDGPDADECASGTVVCAPDLAGVVCVGDVAKTEICNGIDDDCDGDTDEGFEVGVVCDGGDADACTKGVWACKADGSGRFCSGDGATGLYPMLEGSGTSLVSSEGDITAGTISGAHTWLTTDGDATGVLQFAPGGKATFGSAVTLPATTGAFGVRVKMAPDTDTHLYIAGSRQLVISANQPRCVVAGLSPSACTGSDVDWASGYHELVCAFEPGAIRLYVDGVLEKSCAGTVHLHYLGPIRPILVLWWKCSRLLRLVCSVMRPSIQLPWRFSRYPTFATAWTTIVTVRRILPSPRKVLTAMVQTPMSVRMAH